VVGEEVCTSRLKHVKSRHVMIRYGGGSSGSGGVAACADETSARACFEGNMKHTKDDEIQKCHNETMKYKLW